MASKQVEERVSLATAKSGAAFLATGRWRVVYFDAPNRGEQLRLLLILAGVEFDDERIEKYPGGIDKCGGSTPPSVKLDLMDRLSLSRRWHRWRIGAALCAPDPCAFALHVARHRHRYRHAAMGDDSPLMFDQVPLIVAPDGTCVVQVAAAMQFAGAKLNLCPQQPEMARGTSK